MDEVKSILFCFASGRMDQGRTILSGGAAHMVNNRDVDVAVGTADACPTQRVGEITSGVTAVWNGARRYNFYS